MSGFDAAPDGALDNSVGRDSTKRPPLTGLWGAGPRKASWIAPALWRFCGRRCFQARPKAALQRAQSKFCRK